ncbi:MAG: hypothetical protein J6P46_03555 [Bacteroidales bacterium]|nr:hypothetical protein [Bacteroidales bacterium]
MGIEQGIYALVEKSPIFEMYSEAPEIADIWQDFACRMNEAELKSVARSGSFFSYCAGVASYMLEWYQVGGVKITLKRMTLPIKSGLSSSAAICVLVARAFNQLYRLNLNTMGEMNIAYWGELRTASRCGRLDQACAFGSKPVLMSFDGDEVEVKTLNVKEPLYWVFADLCASKNTIKILRDLNRGFPFASNAMEEREHKALGEDNLRIINQAVAYMAKGEVEALGNLMTEAQHLFDTAVAPMCPDELKSPKLHEVLNDPTIKDWVYGGKGVGSQGDGSIQFLAKDKDCQQKVIDYLNSHGMKAYPLDLKPVHSVRKAIIPVAGFGTRLFPASHAISKDFFPIPDRDGMVKPVILILLEELVRSGIEEVCLVLGSDEDRLKYRDFFESPLSEEHLGKLSPGMQEYQNRILSIGRRLRYVYQKEKRGFGHAVYQAVAFANNEPVLLLLGDTLYQTDSNKPCALQMIEKYEQTNKLMVSIHPIPLAEVSHYGILSGTWDDKNETELLVSQMNEKPKASYAEEFLGVKCKDGSQKYMSVFGQYILTPEVFEQLSSDIENATGSNKEIELTSALDKVRERYGMVGVLLQGRMFDMGNYNAFVRCVSEFGHGPQR